MNNNDKAKITTEPSQADIQKLLMQQLMQQQKSTNTGTVAAKRPNVIVRFAVAALKISEGSVKYIDRFINFIVKKADPDRNDVMQTARYPILFGIWVTVICIGVGGTWSALAPLDSAAPAHGTVVVSSHRQKVQNYSGGIIKRIFVKQGDYVIENQPLIELDETKARTDFITSLNLYRTALANEARLVAERDDAATIVFSKFLLDDAHKSEVEKILVTQQELFKSKQEAVHGMLEGLEKQIAQAKHQVTALQAKKSAVDRTLEILEDRFKAYTELNKKGFLDKGKLLETERNLVSIQSEVASTTAEIARNEQEVGRLEVSLFSNKSGNISKIVQELKETHGQVVDYQGRYNNAKEALEHIIIKSPVEGVVNELFFHTIGGVISGNGQEVAEITPHKGKLLLEVKIPPKEIDSLRVGMQAKIRFDSFKSRTTPVFTGTVVSLSKDTVQDKHAQLGPENPYYPAKVEIDMIEFNKIAKQQNLKLLPGMHANIQIVRGTRTLLQYLLDPITDQMFNAFKEK